LKCGTTAAIPNAVTGAGRLTGADLTPNCIVRLNQWRRRRDADGQAEIFIVRQNYRRIGEHFDQQPDTVVPRRKHESRFDGCFV
jgi:hypothetical protein